MRPVTLASLSAAIDQRRYVAFHRHGQCHVGIGKRGAVRWLVRTWSVNGRLQTWKTRPGHFRLPIMSGGFGRQRGDYITHENAHLWHFAGDCPTLPLLELAQRAPQFARALVPHMEALRNV